MCMSSLAFLFLSGWGHRPILICNKHPSHLIMDPRIRFTVTPMSQSAFVCYWVDWACSVFFPAMFSGSVTAPPMGPAWYCSSFSSCVDSKRFWKISQFHLRVNRALINVKRVNISYIHKHTLWTHKKPTLVVNVGPVLLIFGFRNVYWPISKFDALICSTKKNKT